MTVSSPQGFYVGAALNPAGLQVPLCGTQVAQYRARVQNPGAASFVARLEQRLTGLTVGRQYRLTGYVARANVTPTAPCQFLMYASNVNLQNLLNINTLVNGGLWHKVTGVWTAQSDSVVLQVLSICNGREDLFVDQISFAPVIVA